MTTTLTMPSQSLSQLITARLRRFMALQGHTTKSLAQALDMHRTTLQRKFDNQRFNTDDLDRILSGLEGDPLDLLRPVIRDGDLEIMRWIEDQHGVDQHPTVARAEAIFVGAGERLQELADQWLIHEYPTGLAVTALGRSLLRS